MESLTNNKNKYGHNIWRLSEATAANSTNFSSFFVFPTSQTREVNCSLCCLFQFHKLTISAKTEVVLNLAKAEVVLNLAVKSWVFFYNKINSVRVSIGRWLCVINDRRQTHK